MRRVSDRLMNPTPSIVEQVGTQFEGPGTEIVDYRAMIAECSDRLLRLTRVMLRGFDRLRRWEQTDDVFQSAMIRFCRALEDVRPVSTREFFALAAVQIRRTLIDLARHHFGPEGAAAHHFSDPVGDRLRRHETDVVVDARPESLLAWTEFHNAVERLPDELREPFQLRWYAGVPQSEAAQLLGVSVSTIQRRWYMAQIRLFELMHGESPLEETRA